MRIVNYPSFRRRPESSRLDRRIIIVTTTAPPPLDLKGERPQAMEATIMDDTDRQPDPHPLNPEDWPDYDPEAIIELNKSLADLRARGILSGGGGSRERMLKPIAHRPGALARFLAERRGEA